MTYQNFTAEELNSEIWKDIPNYEGRYQASNLGRIKGVFIRFNFPEPRILKPKSNGWGYLQINFYDSTQKRKTFSVHRLVLLAFKGDSELQTNHKNGIKSDNRLKNLEYATSSKNNRHALKLGLRVPPKGEKHYRAKLTKKEVEYIRKEMLNGKTQKSLATEFGVCIGTISAIKRNKNWKE